MTEEQIREEIARSIALFFPLCQWTDWATLPQVYKDECFYPLADQILSIKGIRIEADDQSLPKLATALEEPLEFLRRNNPESFAAGANAAYGGILTPDSEGKVWVKCLKKEGRVPYYASGEWKGEIEEEQ